MRKLITSLHNVSSGVTVWQAIPPIGVAMTAAATAFWGWAADWGYLPIFLAVLFVSVATVWLVIGLRFLGDGLRLQSASGGLDCAWGVELGYLQLNKDPNSPIAEWQLKTEFINRFQWPLRLYIEKTQLRIESISPEEIPHSGQGVILIGRKQVSDTMFKPGLLPDREIYSGSIFLQAKYGHPDLGYTRRMIREYKLEGRVQYEPNTGHAVCILGRFPIKEEDEPIIANH